MSKLLTFLHLVYLIKRLERFIFEAFEQNEVAYLVPVWLNPKRFWHQLQNIHEQ